MFSTMRCALLLVVLALVVDYVTAVSPVVIARSKPSKRFASPVEARAPHKPSPRFVARSKPSPRFVPRSKPSPRFEARSKPSPRLEARSKPSPRFVARSKPSPRFEARGEHPEPSKRPHPRRDMEEQTAFNDLNAMLCPSGLSACPVESTATLPKTLAEWATLDHECVELETDLQSCGGCASIDTRCVSLLYHRAVFSIPHPSHDCTTIDHAVNVACVTGGCQVHSCVTGYSVSFDRKSCIAN